MKSSASIAAIVETTLKPAQSARPNEYTLKWIRHQIGAELIDLDLFARCAKSPLARDGVKEFVTEAYDKARAAESIWLNPPWDAYKWLGGWLQDNARGKKIVVLTSRWYYNNVLRFWPVVWNTTLSLPRQHSLFLDENEEDYPPPSFEVLLLVGRVLG